MGSVESRRVDMRHIALAVWLFGWLGIFSAYASSALGDHVASCVPHFTGCASVSASGRHGAGFFLFKALMIPVAVLLGVYWLLCDHWLRTAGDAPARWRRSMLVIGVLGAVALVVYATFLGADDEAYRDTHRAMRRYGTAVFFGFTYLAQLLLLYRARAVFGNTPVAKVKLVLCVGMLVEGLALEVLTLFVANDAWLENLTEWHVVTALGFYPFLTWLMWRRTGLEVTFRVAQPRDGD